MWWCAVKKLLTHSHFQWLNEHSVAVINAGWLKGVNNESIASRSRKHCSPIPLPDVQHEGSWHFKHLIIMMVIIIVIVMPFAIYNILWCCHDGKTLAVVTLFASWIHCSTSSWSLNQFNQLWRQFCSHCL